MLSTTISSRLFLRETDEQLNNRPEPAEPEPTAEEIAAAKAAEEERQRKIAAAKAAKAAKDAAAAKEGDKE